jgi:hypothetical protein
MASPINDSSLSSLSSSTPPAAPSPNLLLGGVLAGTTLAITLGLTAPFVFTRSPLPYMATPKDKVARALKYLHTKHYSTHNNHNYTSCKRPLFVDLGSGDGETLYQAADVGYRAVGYELNFTMWFLSSIRRMTWHSSHRAHTTIHYGNFFYTKLPHETNVVMMFGVTPLMKKFSAKLHQELKVGGHIMSYRFELPTRETCDNIDADPDDELVKATLVYDLEEMRIYQVQGQKESDK